MRINGNAIKPGMIVEHKKALWLVTKSQSVKPGKGGAFNQVEMKNIKNNSKKNERFRASEEVERVRVDEEKFQYLYQLENKLIFMNLISYEQIELDKEFAGDKLVLLSENDEVIIDMEYEEYSGNMPDMGYFEYSDIIYGDVNLDSIINILDIVLMVNIIFDQNSSDIFSMEAADMNQDNIINVLDIVELLNLILDN